MWTIIKKEVKSYFLSPIAYIFIGLFLFMNSIFFYLDVYAIGRVNFEYMFGSLATVLTFAVPILTMRMFASSITENQIIAGVITIAGLLVIWFMPSFYSSLSNFSLINVFSNTFPQGIMTWPALTLFISFTVMFIILTIIVIQRRKSVK